jgi:shikimate dehydrogenase
MTYYKLGLIGYPIGHSVSPQIHSTALAAVGLDGEYELYPIAPDDKQGLIDLLAKVRTGELHGLNVTIPHKQNVMPLLDKLTPTAAATGAVNTVVLKAGKLVGDNTDADGFWHDLQVLLSQAKTKEKNTLIFGAGGSARAAAYALLQHGWDVTISARRIEQAESLVTHYSSSQIKNAPYNPTALQSLLPTLSLIVNTTPVGMKSHPQGSPWIEGLSFPPKAALYDLIYNPAETQLMKDAAQAGLPVRNGLGMLIGQALLSFEIWTGHKVPVEKISLTV